MNLSGENIFSKLHDRLILRRHIHPFTSKNENREISKRNTICLFCQPRGGSTWLAELLQSIPESVLIDEPLWRGCQKNPWNMPLKSDRKVPAIAELDFYFNQHIPEFEIWPDAKNLFEEILAGRIPSKGLYEEQDYVSLKRSGLYIIKFCYGNLLMPWLISQFEFNAILFTRHPCAVISSQLKHPSWKQLEVLSNGVLEEFPFHEIYKKALDRIGKLESVEMYLAMIWALNFKETAMHPENNQKWMTMSYESLLLNFESEINRINQRFHFDLKPESLDQTRLSKSIDRYALLKTDIKDQLSSWQTELSKKQISDILKVLEIFEIDIYGDALEPDYGTLYSNEKRP